MCTLTFIPGREGEFYFSVNRDETPLRGAAKMPGVYTIGHETMLFPKDQQGGGSWFVVTKSKKAASLMNGAFQKHKRNPPYKKSRGLVLLDFLQYDSPAAFSEAYDLEGIEPFTIVCFYYPDRLYDCRWDGDQFHIQQLNTDKKHIWSSAPLYNTEQHAQRKKWFKEWFTESSPLSRKYIKDFHLNAGKDDLFNSVCMNRFGVVASVSFTSLILNNESAMMQYKDLISGEETEVDFSLEKKNAEF